MMLDKLKTIRRICNIHVYEIRKILNVDEQTFQKWMRSDDPEKEKLILDAMIKLKPESVKKALRFLKWGGLQNE